MSKTQITVIAVLCLMLSMQMRCALVECISESPKTFEENEMLEFVKDCLLRNTKYEITYKYDMPITQNYGRTTAGWVPQKRRLPFEELLLEADYRYLRKNEANRK